MDMSKPNDFRHDNDAHLILHYGDEDIRLRDEQLARGERYCNGERS